jgi:hypothetical protein
MFSMAALMFDAIQIVYNRHLENPTIELFVTHIATWYTRHYIVLVTTQSVLHDEYHLLEVVFFQEFSTS